MKDRIEIEGKITMMEQEGGYCYPAFVLDGYVLEHMLERLDLTGVYSVKVIPIEGEIEGAFKTLTEKVGKGKWQLDPPVFLAAPWPTEHQAYRSLEAHWSEYIHSENPEKEDVLFVKGYLDGLFCSGMLPEPDYLDLAEFLDSFIMMCWKHDDETHNSTSFWDQILGGKS